MFAPEPSGENPYESEEPQAPLPARPLGEPGGSAPLGSVGLELAEHEEPFAWPEGTREVDELGRDLFAVAKGELEGQQRRLQSGKRASWRRGLWRKFGEGLLIGGLQLGTFSAVVHVPWSWSTQPLLAAAGAIAMGIASVRNWGTLETALIMTLTWVGFGTYLAADSMQAILVALLSAGVISTSKFMAQAFEDPLR